MAAHDVGGSRFVPPIQLAEDVICEPVDIARPYQSARQGGDADV